MEAVALLLYPKRQMLSNERRGVLQFILCFYSRLLIDKLTAGIHKVNIVTTVVIADRLDAARYWHQVYDLGPLMIANKFELRH